MSSSATTSNPLSLPNRSIDEATRQSRAGAAAAGASQARPIVGFKAAPGGPGAAAALAPRLVKKKKAGRGRMMMVKVFYSLASSRSDAAPPPPPTSALSTQPSAVSPSSAFLAVLDPSLAPPPPPPPPPTQPTASAPPQQHQQHAYSCIARLSSPVWVQMMGSASTRSATDEREGTAKRPRPTEYGMLTLKTCLSAICISRPELVSDPTKDYAVSAVDPYESSLQPQHPTNSASSHASTSALPSSAMEVGGGQGLMEGKGMLSWNLAEKREGTTWVCGRVVSNDTGRGGGGRDKRRKTDDDEDDGEREEDEDDESEDEGVKETLEVWLQLVERPSFTQTQFLTSLRSFANPAQQPQPSSDRPSSPPPRRRPLPPSHQKLSRQPSTGDPVKRRSPRDVGQLPRQPIASTSAGTPVDAIASLQDPQVLALLAQLLPSLGIGAPQPAPSTSLSTTAFALDTAQGRALLPAIRTLAKFYGVAVPESASVEVTDAPSMTDKGKGRQVPDAYAPFPNLNAPSSSAAPPPSAQVAPPVTKKPALRRKAGRAKSRDEAFVAVAVVGKGNHNPMDPDGGCSNCPRKKSAVWREGESQNGITVTVCNACGTYFNKNNHHRTTDRTSPIKANPAKLAAVASGRRSVSQSSAGRPLQGRLTATCEADLKKAKKRRSKGPGIVPPPSPSKLVGPSSRLSPGTLFRHGPSASRPFLTSPGARSPRRSTRNVGAATSPGGRNAGAGLGLGLGSGYRSDGEERGGMDYSSIFGAPNSPSPTRHRHAMPSYLLTASPGTALARILSDTSVDHFDLPMGEARDNSHATTSGNDNDLSFYIRSSPDEKENAIPTAEFGLTANALTTSLPGASSTTADYDSLLSSLRRDFNARLSSSNGLTAPSSPTPSSPCVQPRTSSATPGQKGKAPASCGRPAPSILDASFLDTLVPAVALNAVDTPSDSDAWTPVSMGDHDLDRTLMQLDHGTTSDGGASTYSFSHRHPPIPFHLTARFTATSPDYDFGGSLPPSSPPALPSEANPTPSEFDSGVTPDEEGYLESEDDTYRSSYEDPTTRQDAVAALLQSLGATSASSSGTFGGAVANQPGGDMVSLDRSTVAHLLQMIAGGGHHQQHAPPPPPPVEEPSPFDVSGLDAFGGKDDVAPPEGDQQQDTQLHQLYQSLFSDTAGFENM